MKRLSCILIPLILTLTGADAGIRPGGKVLVLGFDSALLNDIQDRLLRETLIREFKNRGREIVTVMEIESLLVDNGKIQIRRLSVGDLRKYCAALHAEYAVTGKIHPPDGKKKIVEIEENTPFTCEILLYQKTADRTEKFRISAVGKKNYYETVGFLCKMIAEELIEK